MKNKLPFKKGDILFNSVSKKFVYIDESKLCIDEETISYSFVVIGNPSENLQSSGTEGELALYMTRYGNIDDIKMTEKELKSIDIYEGDSKEQGLRIDKLNRELKMNFLLSY